MVWREEVDEGMRVGGRGGEDEAGMWRRRHRWRVIVGARRRRRRCVVIVVMWEDEAGGDVASSPCRCCSACLVVPHSPGEMRASHGLQLGRLISSTVCT